jgi:hypothetical protein
MPNKYDKLIINRGNGAELASNISDAMDKIPQVVFNEKTMMIESAEPLLSLLRREPSTPSEADDKFANLNPDDDAFIHEDGEDQD